VLKLVDSYWAEFFGCPPEALRTDTPQIVAHAELGDYAGCYLMEFGGAPIVSLPVGKLEPSRGAIGQLHAGVVVPQYRTLEGNAPSMAVAKRLGFVHYATSLALRFASPNR
jgi:hypothetical protein